MRYCSATLGLLAVSAFVFGGTGCLSTTDFQSKAGRVTDLSAYSLDTWEMRTGLGLVGTTLDDVGANIPLEVGLPGNVQLGTNLAHDIGTLLNLNAKWTALDLTHFGLAVEVGVKWTNPSLGQERGAGPDRDAAGDLRHRPRVAPRAHHGDR
jgi:hypothetical protein